jgi:AAA15 family ATPase/GTPase
VYQLAIKVKKYKCFDEEAGFDVIRRVNLIIGRNNSGKSSLLDLIDAVTSEKYGFDGNMW